MPCTLQGRTLERCALAYDACGGQPALEASWPASVRGVLLRARHCCQHGRSRGARSAGRLRGCSQVGKGRSRLGLRGRRAGAHGHLQPAPRGRPGPGAVAAGVHAQVLPAHQGPGAAVRGRGGRPGPPAFKQPSCRARVAAPTRRAACSSGKGSAQRGPALPGPSACGCTRSRTQPRGPAMPYPIVPKPSARLRAARTWARSAWAASWRCSQCTR